jgi:hypothetical protein
VQPPPEGENRVRAGTNARAQKELPYTVERWHIDGSGKVELVLARAANAQLARAIFKAAQGEHPEHRITLRRGNRIIADSSSSAASARD